MKDNGLSTYRAMRRTIRETGMFWLAALGLATSSLYGSAQTSPAPPLPDAPSTVAAAKHADQSARQKFQVATQNAFCFPALLFAAAGAGINQGQNLYPEFHQGARGYARNYWHVFADQTVDAYAVNFILPVALHQDPRYYPSHQGGVWNRTGYALSRLLVTRTDSGKTTFNTSQVLGSGAAASISSLYYPAREGHSR